MTQLHLEEQLRAVYDALSQLSQSLIIINCLLLHQKPGRLNSYQLLGATRHAGGTGRNIRTVLQRTTTRGVITDSSTADGAYLDRYAQAWHTCTTFNSTNMGPWCSFQPRREDLGCSPVGKVNCGVPSVVIFNLSKYLLYTSGVLPQAVPVLILSYRVLTVQPHLVPITPVLVYSALRCKSVNVFHL